MELTIENLISFIKEDIKEDGEILPTNTITGDFGINGIEAFDLLEHLEKEFEMSFEDFDFRKYFLEENEIIKSISWLGLRKPRKIERELTIQKLYEYMLQHKK
ncbi:DUF1493 family protein [Chryseobacterium echinoideorum]|uniref:DUF1493 family protein n=1 Tax=Chryseobacterium echinoideorum TaxID=1549648 RepID=UPI0011860082|nr:DUF1493 family protein [Chryseobacterium echinoideorum]